ncbi:peroxiredoxin 2-like [Arctopsyche grandis]|uniref:peroxiredoxin 2-like n=1 Tax=Arctopsyche grandis TaxID=121162 RepID=UPI00406D63F0
MYRKNVIIREVALGIIVFKNFRHSRVFLIFPHVKNPAELLYKNTYICTYDIAALSWYPIRTYLYSWLLFYCSTFVCPTEIIAFSDRVDEFKKINCEVVAASTDSHFSHLAWINTPRKEGGLGEMKIPLLADKSTKIARDYNVLNVDSGIPFRGLYIIDGNQKLRQITVNDLPVGRDVDETLRLVQAFQYTDKHGEVCPAGWKPGQKTMKADPKGSQEYFNSAN